MFYIDTAISAHGLLDDKKEDNGQSLASWKAFLEALSEYLKIIFLSLHWTLSKVWLMQLNLANTYFGTIMCLTTNFEKHKSEQDNWLLPPPSVLGSLFQIREYLWSSSLPFPCLLPWPPLARWVLWVISQLQSLPHTNFLDYHFDWLLLYAKILNSFSFPSPNLLPWNSNITIIWLQSAFLFLPSTMPFRNTGWVPSKLDYCLPSNTPNYGL